MAKVISCQCGATIKGETDDEVIAAAEKHMQAEHPSLAGKLSRDQILGMVEERQAGT